ncbi:MAG: formate dehydrogenase subunit gamma [Dehalococcoidia bacterium]|nr:formate dehydrogenase subunit gamma [Dehalococcoidia bacterium]
MKDELEVERYSRGARLFHWTMTIAALVLAVTGLILYVHPFGAAAAGGYTRIIHRIAAVIFVASPLVFLMAKPRRSVNFVKEIFTWGKDDIEWLKAAPDYYFGGDEKKMPPQPDMNSGQKLWALVAFLSAIGFIVTGMLMWFFKNSIPAELFQWATIIHDLCFIVAGAMLLVHLYLGAVHPRMTESLKSMISGKLSVKFAKSHYGKWYEEKTKGTDSSGGLSGMH